MKAKNERFTLEENLVLTNEELISNWAKFASFIVSYEKIDWVDAQLKARKLLSEKKAIDYINEARELLKKEVAISESPVEEVKAVPIENLTTGQKTVYQKNYDRIQIVAPNIISLLSNAKKGDTIYGKSEQTGYMDFNIELVHMDKENYYLSLSHYYTQNGDLVPDPDMVIRFNINQQIAEALSFQNSMVYREVYDDAYKRKMVNPKEKKSQNAFLTTWLINLINQGHMVQWRYKDDEEADSDFKVEYRKEEQKKPEKEVEMQDTEIEEETNEDKGQEIQDNIEMKEEKKSNEPVKHWGKLLTMMTEWEQDYNSEKADRKALQLYKSGELADYLIQSYKKVQIEQVRCILEFNYKLFFGLMPNLKKHFEQSEENLVFSSAKINSLPIYEFVKAADANQSTKQYAIYEKTEKKKKGKLLISVNERIKKLWITVLTDGFQNQGNYSYDEKGTLGEKYSIKRFKANLVVQNWLVFLLTEEYILQIDSKQTADSSKKDKEEALTREKLLENYKDNAKNIPDFEVGKVEYTEYHKKAGIPKKVINWINKHKTGLTLSPKESFVYNTKNELLDKSHHAKRPGLRISRTGKLYYEGRSNRSDLTNTGL